MADLNYDVSVNTTAAIRNLDNLNKKVGTVGGAFQGLQRVLGGLAIGTIINQTLQWADSIKDLSDAVDISVASVVGFSRAVQENGGTAEDAQKALLKFNESVYAAKNGSKEALYAFEQLGVSIDDIAKYNNEILLSKTIEGFREIKDRGEAANRSLEIFNKTLRGTTLNKLAETYNKSTVASIKYEDAIIKAADVNQKLEGILFDLRIVLLKLLTPIADLAKGIRTNIDAISKWADIISSALIPLALLLIPLGRIFNVAKGVGVAFYSTGVLIKDFIVNIKNLFVALANPLTRSSLIQNLKQLPGLIPGVRSFFSAVTNYATDAGKKIGGFVLGLIGLDKAIEKWRSYQEDFSKPLVIEGGEAMRMPFNFAEERTRRAEEAKRLRDAFLEQKVAIQAVTEAFAKQNAEQIKNIQTQQLAFDISENQLEIYNAVSDISTRAADEIAKLVEQRSKLKDVDAALIPIINAQIDAIRNRAQVDAAAITQSLQDLDKRRIAEEKLRLTLELSNQQLQDNASLQSIRDQIALVGLYGDELENNQALLDVTQELQNKLLDIQQKMAELELRRTQLGEERYNQELQNLQVLQERAYVYAEERLRLEEEYIAKQRELSQDWQKEIGRQLEELADSISPVRMATDLFGSVIDSVDNALTEFVNKGKFSFKDFARSLLRDMALIIGRAIIMRTILAAFGMAGFGPLASAGSSGLQALNYTGPMFGGAAAKGGNLSAGKSYLVGELGPELFVPKTAGTVVPNNQLGAMGGSTTVNYNINAVDAASFRSLVSRDPQFIFNVTEVGRRSSPNRRLA